MKFLVFLALTAAAAPLAADPWSYTKRSLFPSAIVSTATVDWNGEQETAEDKKTEADPPTRIWASCPFPPPGTANKLLP